MVRLPLCWCALAGKGKGAGGISVSQSALDGVLLPPVHLCLVLSEMMEERVKGLFFCFLLRGNLMGWIMDPTRHVCLIVELKLCRGRFWDEPGYCNADPSIVSATGWYTIAGNLRLAQNWRWQCAAGWNTWNTMIAVFVLLLAGREIVLVGCRIVVCLRM